MDAPKGTSRCPGLVDRVAGIDGVGAETSLKEA
jgi:hypothetical protein